MTIDPWKSVGKPSEYAYSEKKLEVKKWSGGSIEIQIGYVKKHPDEVDIRLVKTWTVKGGEIKSQYFNIKPEDWADIKGKIEELVPELAKTITKNDIDNVMSKITHETQLLELVARYPELMEQTEKVDILLLPEDQKKALSTLLSVGGAIANSIITQLSKVEVKDLKGFVDLLKQMKLSTINSLVTHITSRLSFIALFERVIHDEKSYEIRGENSVHNLLKQNMWIIDRNYSILYENTTLKKILIEKWGETLLGRQGQERPDFLCMTNDEGSSGSNRIIIIEIKKPSVKLTMDHFTQLMEYRSILQKYSGKKIDEYKCFLVGRELSDLLQSTDLSNSGFVTKTYTDFIQEARQFYKEYRKIVEKESLAF